jgi:hypothetical protein
MTIKYNKFNTESIIGSYCVFPNSEKSFVLDGLNRSGLMVGAFLYSCKEEEYNTYSMINKINIQTGDSKISKWVLVDKMNYLNYPPTNLNNVL